MNRANFTVLCTVFLVAFGTSSIYAAASCCDPKNNAGPSFLSLPDAQTSRPALPPVQTQNAAPLPRLTGVTSMGSGWNDPQRQGYSRPSGAVNAPAAPSCCPRPSNPSAQQGKPPVGGCGCAGGGSGCQRLQQGSVLQPAAPYPQPAVYRYLNQQNPASNGAAYRPASSGPLW